jgi:hypothetical protein
MALSAETDSISLVARGRVNILREFSRVAKTRSVRLRGMLHLLGIQVDEVINELVWGLRFNLEAVASLERLEEGKSVSP